VKICVTAKGSTLDSPVDPRFGRCAYFIIVEPETLDFTAIENPHAEAMGGAGIQSGQLISEKGATVLLTGNVGPNAYQTLEAGGIAVITGVSGSVESAVRAFSRGELTPNNGATVSSHHGMKSGE